MRCIFQNQIKLFLVLEEPIKSQDVGMREARLDLDFILYLVSHLAVFDRLLLDYLQSNQSIASLVLGEKYTTKPSLSQTLPNLEVLNRERWI